MDEPRKKRVLKQHLLTDRLLGVSSVPLGQAKPIAAEPIETEVESSAPTPIPSSSRVRADVFAAPVTEDLSPHLDRATKLKLLEEMDVSEVRGCTKCVLCKGRTQTVFGEGNPDAKLMFIGEGPGQTEDELGRPFVGRAGELLDKMIVAMGLKREEVYIANVVKCRPPENRAPLPPEVAACRGYLERQIETIRPRAIVTVGGPATKLILNTEKGITAIRGIWAEYRRLGSGLAPIPVMPTFHPAYLLRAYTEDNRRKVWSDLKKARDLVMGTGTP